jgi:hypothetical protein
MKLLKILLSTALFPLSVAAQTTSGSIAGTVHDIQGKALPGASVLVLKASDSTIVKVGGTDATGAFLVDPLPEGDYLVKVSFTGMRVGFSGPVSVTSSSPAVRLQDVALTENAKTALKEVAVRAQKPLIEARADKTIVNVESSITSTGSTALEVLARAPGVNVDNNDNISLKGRAGVTVMIDGKIVPVQGADLANLLKGMPSGSIEKIELISNPGSRYDAAGTAGIINIKLKKDQRMGTNGTITLGIGQGVYPKGNAGASLNYRNKKLTVYANYNAAKRYGFNHLWLDRQFLQPRTLLTDVRQPNGAYVQDNFGRIEFDNQYGNLGVDYAVSKKTTIGAIVSGGRNGHTFKGDNRSDVYNGAMQPLSYYLTTTDQDNRNNNGALNLNLRHQFDSTGRELSIDADAARYTNSSNQTVNAHYYGISGGETASPYALLGALDGSTTIRSLKADYTHPLKKGGKIEAGFKTSFVTADNQPIFYDYSSGTRIYDTTKSNHFVYDENINAAYVNAAKDWTAWSTQLGLRVENTMAKGVQDVQNQNFDRAYTQLFPSLAVIRHLNPKHDLGVTLSRRIERPSYQQLNPFRNYIDPRSLHQGNPYLNPAFTYAAEITHTYKNQFSTTLGYSRTTDGITQVILPEINPVDSSQTTVVTERNLATVTNYSLSGAYPVQITKRWNSTNSFNLYYSLYEGTVAGTAISAGTPAFQLNTTNSITLPRDWTAEVSAWYQSAQRYGYMYLFDMYSVNLGLQKSLWNRTATVKLSVNDLFWKQNPRGRNEFLNYYENFTVQRDSRVATLTFSYRFGKRTVAPVRRRSTGAEEEKQRVGGGSGGA